MITKDKRTMILNTKDNFQNFKKDFTIYKCVINVKL